MADETIIKFPPRGNADDDEGGAEAGVRAQASGCAASTLLLVGVLFALGGMAAAVGWFLYLVALAALAAWGRLTALWAVWAGG